jgi:hypothetical protein
MSHRILIDVSIRRVVAGQDRKRKRWHAMSVEHVDYMQQIIEETFPDLFDDLQEYHFEPVDEPPQWALQAWPWPPLPEYEDDLRE